MKKKKSSITKDVQDLRKQISGIHKEEEGKIMQEMTLRLKGGDGTI